MDTNYTIELPVHDPAQNRLMVRLRRRIMRSIRKPAPTPTATGWPAMPYPTVELAYWRPSRGVNFGDELSRTTVELMLARRGLTVFDEIPKTRRMLAIGSIMHVAEDDSIVWGSGVNGSVSEFWHKYKTLDVRAVRGPVTRKFLMARGIEVPEVYGDPGLLVKVLTNGRFETSKKVNVGFVPHMSEFGREDVTKLIAAGDVSVIDPRGSWNKVVAEIARCEFVISSSLHGLVVADAFDIPSIYVRLSDHEGLLKYEDYYAGTGRDLQFATSIQEAFARGPCAKARYDQKALLDAFPYDIWSN